MFSRNLIYPLPREGLFPYISVATVTRSPGISLISSNEMCWICEIRSPSAPCLAQTSISNSFVRKIIRQTWLNRREQVSFDTMPSPDILGLAVMLNKTFPSPTAKSVLQSYCYSVWLYSGSYSTNIQNKSEYGP